MKYRASITLTLLLFFALITVGSEGAEISVNSTSDLINGNVSNPNLLLSNPGPDGISLREALTAINTEVGPHIITFPSAMSGKVIRIVSSLPVIRQDYVTVKGLTDTQGSPRVIIDVPTGDIHVFTPYASYFTLRGVKIQGIRGTIGATGVFIRAGRPNDQPQVIRDTVIEGNEFVGSTGSVRPGNAITIGTDGDSVGAIIKNITIARNTFRNFIGDTVAFGNGTDGTNARFENLLIRDNVFTKCTFPIELAADGGINGKLDKTQILRNIFDNV